AGKIFGFDGQTLQEVIVQMLLEKNEKLSVAESCTGGNIGHLITSVPGASMCFEGGIISYSNKAKINQLSVLPETIDKYGAVSREVVEEMAMGVMRKMNTDYAIAVSGIAGPGGGTEDKPVGTTWIAVADKKKVIAQSFLFGDHRGRNITKSSNTALNMLKKVILGESW
ncbi:MAG: damage-inducible protein CinA, partial [Marinilabiliales bacterium]